MPRGRPAAGVGRRCWRSAPGAATRGRSWPRCGTRGGPAGAPYDGVIVTAAGPSVPQPLLKQLSEDGGRLTMPVGERRHQQLTVVERRGSELISSRRDPVVFVPLIGEYGFGE